jgi:hypothetical protein
VSKYTTKRFIFSAFGFLAATYLCVHRYISGGDWVSSLGIVLCAHHAEDIVNAWRNPNVGTDHP